MTDPALSWRPPRPGSPLRGALVLAPVALWAFLYALFGGLYLILWPKRWQLPMHRVIRLWGRVGLALMGIRLEVHDRERLEQAGAALLVFNHVSLLDLWIVTAIWPPNGTVLYKKEFDRIPMIGFAMHACGMIPIDRASQEDARRTMRLAAERIREKSCKLIVAPEGTRSRRGGLQGFKMGPFHLAAETRAPMIPFITRGIETVMPMGSFLARSGVVRIDVLPPIDTSDWSPREVRRHAREVRARFLRYLAPASGAD